MLVVGMMVLGPLLGAGNINANIMMTDQRHKFIMGELEPKISSNIEKSEEIIKRLELEYS